MNKRMKLHIKWYIVASVLVVAMMIGIIIVTGKGKQPEVEETGEILPRETQAEEFPEIESVQACFLRGQGPIYKQLDQVSEVFYQNSEKLKAKVWEDRGFNFKDCHVLGHCGKCADKKLCANVRRIGRLSEAHRINQ